MQLVFHGRNSSNCMRPPSNFSASGLQRILMLRRPNRFMKPNPAEMLIRPFEREDKKHIILQAFLYISAYSKPVKIQAK